MDGNFLSFLAIGFFAQLVDGALGMAFGVTTALLTLGLSPAHASAMVHTAEVFTTGTSAISHTMHNNTNRRLVIELAVARSVGAIIGAYVLSNIDGHVVRPFIAAYLLVLGLSILLRAFQAPPETDTPPSFAAPLGIVGGFLDAIGGGGWGRPLRPPCSVRVSPRAQSSARSTRPSSSSPRRQRPRFSLSCD